MGRTKSNIGATKFFGAEDTNGAAARCATTGTFGGHCDPTGSLYAKCPVCSKPRPDPAVIPGGGYRMPKLPAGVLACDVFPTDRRVLSNCSTCRHGGAVMVEWALNQKRCPAYFDDPSGRCFYEMLNRSVPFNKDDVPTPQAWLSDMREYFHIVGLKIKDELIKRQALGIPGDGDVKYLKSAINLIESYHTHFAHAQKMKIFSALLESEGDTGGTIFRIIAALVRDGEASEEAIASFGPSGNGSEQLGMLFRNFISDVGRLIEASAEADSLIPRIGV